MYSTVYLGILTDPFVPDAQISSSPVSVSGRNVVGQTVVAVKIMLYSEGQPKHPMETKSPVLTLCFDSLFNPTLPGVLCKQ